MKSRSSTNWNMPLLTKELVEQAARPQTYIVRVVYAALVCIGLTVFAYIGEISWSASPAELMGTGRRFFEVIVYLQFAGIFLFLPPLMGSAITYEKERDTLSLLFL